MRIFVTYRTGWVFFVSIHLLVFMALDAGLFSVSTFELECGFSVVIE